MWSKNKRAKTQGEKRHIERIKSMPCAVCEAPPPSDAHHISQSSHYLTIPLCRDCHQGGFNGIHGQRRIWEVKRMDELAALGATVKRLMGEA